MFLIQLLEQFLGLKSDSILNNSKNIGGMTAEWPLASAFYVYQNGLWYYCHLDCAIIFKYAYYLLYQKKILQTQIDYCTFSVNLICNDLQKLLKNTYLNEYLLKHIFFSNHVQRDTNIIKRYFIFIHILSSFNIVIKSP